MAARKKKKTLKREHQWEIAAKKLGHDIDYIHLISSCKCVLIQ